MRELPTGIDKHHILCEAEKCELVCGPPVCSRLHPQQYQKHETEVLVFVLKFTGESVLPGACNSKWQCGPAACGAGDDPLCSLPSQRH